MELKVDLHLHSSASDGNWTPEKIMRIAHEKGIGFISLTDHDDIRNVKKAAFYAKKFGISFLKGVEISSALNGKQVHILAYGIDINNEDLNELLRNNRKLLKEKDDAAMKYLKEKGYDIDINDYEKYEHDSSKGGFKSLSYLMKIGVCKDIEDYFGRIFKNTDLKYPDFPHPKKVVEVVKKAGGICVLAHPYYSKSDEEVDKRLRKFIDFGIEGVECFHPNHSDETTKECLKWCEENNVISTAGSDCHGDFIKTRHIGKPAVFLKQVDLKYLYNLFE